MSLQKDYDYLFKLVIIGDSGVGKSSLLLRYADDTFNDNYLTTIGVDFRFKSIQIDGKNAKLQIWDTAGQERFRTLTNAYYRGADGIIVVYDITSPLTFENIDKYWMKEIQTYADKDVDIILIGNKCDATRQVPFEIGQQLATSKGMSFYETSAKTSEAVIDTFAEIAKRLLQKKELQYGSFTKKSPTLRSPSKTKKKETEKKCC
eukprot:TRINITY_DN6678_c0_g1_i5.p1 TRINITY_DN6678_c0_g1~~TRINITY_DN6678_c0_g1_i5.p1  ORF type:complete len:205 (+),score=57.40 TRINITY_DN6678_c0_g1_i5:266-880(+)